MHTIIISPYANYFQPTVSIDALILMPHLLINYCIYSICATPSNCANCGTIRKVLSLFLEIMLIVPYP